MADDTVWRGVFIEESLDDPSLLDEVTVVGSSAVRLEEEAERGEFTFKRVEVPDKAFGTVIARAAQAIKPAWYLHLVSGDQMKVVFRDRVFAVSRGDASALRAVVDYGVGQGIHPAQLDLARLFDHPFD
jgi:hypothetical protein